MQTLMQTGRNGHFDDNAGAHAAILGQLAFGKAREGFGFENRILRCIAVHSR